MGHNFDLVFDNWMAPKRNYTSEVSIFQQYYKNTTYYEKELSFCIASTLLIYNVVTIFNTYW